MITMLKVLKRGERGFTFVEVLIAITIISVCVVTYLTGLIVGLRGLVVADEQQTAESLARSQMEYVEMQDYEWAADGGDATYSMISDVEPGYSIWSVGRTGEVQGTGILAIPWNSELAAGWNSSMDHAVTIDIGVQKVVLIIKRGDKEVWRLEAYKVKH